MIAGMLDRYLDGLMTAEERAVFERSLEQDAALGGEIACQRRIDASLERQFAPAALDRIAARVTTAALINPPSVRADSTRVRRRTYAIAAGIALFIVGAVQLWTEFGPRAVVDPYAPQPWRSFTQVYDDTLDAGFRPKWVCKDDREFETVFRRRLGQALAIAAPPPGIAWAGVDYCHSITPATVTILAYVNGREVLVFADRAAGDKAVQLSKKSSLNLFRRVAGDLVLYEFTPFAEPHLLDLFYVPAFPGPLPQ